MSTRSQWKSESQPQQAPTPADTSHRPQEMAELSAKRRRLDTRSPNDHNSEDLSFVFISPRMEGILERWLDDCSSAEKLFKCTQTIFGFFNKATEICCLICKVKDSNTPLRYILDQSETDFQRLLEDVQKIESVPIGTLKAIEVRLVTMA